MKHIKLFESFLNEDEKEKNMMESFLEDFMDSEYKATYSVDPPEPGEYNLDSESHHPILTVWAELCLDPIKYNEAAEQLDDDYEKFAKNFVDKVKEKDLGWEPSILTRAEDNVIVFQLTTEY